MANGHSRGQRQRKEWASIPSATMALVGNGTTGGGFASFTAASTILRCLMEYIIRPTIAPTALENALITVALGVVSSDAVELGATAMPDPNDEPEYPWLYWAEHAFFFSATGLDNGGPVSGVRKFADIRSMRKIKPREALVWVVQYTDLVGTPALQVTLGSTRVLLGIS